MFNINQLFLVFVYILSTVNSGTITASRNSNSGDNSSNSGDNNNINSDNNRLRVQTHCHDIVCVEKYVNIVKSHPYIVTVLFVNAYPSDDLFNAVYETWLMEYFSIAADSNSCSRKNNFQREFISNTDRNSSKLINIDNSDDSNNTSSNDDGASSKSADQTRNYMNITYAELFLNFNNYRRSGGQVSTEEMSLIFNRTVELLPVNSIFVLLNCGDSKRLVTPQIILDNRISNSGGCTSSDSDGDSVEKIIPNVLVHLNHEQPWSDYNDPYHYESNHCYGASNNNYNSIASTKTKIPLVKLYQRFETVIRQYYYEPYQNDTIYLPLGPFLYDVLKQYRSELAILNMQQYCKVFNTLRSDKLIVTRSLQIVSSENYHEHCQVCIDSPENNCASTSDLNYVVTTASRRHIRCFFIGRFSYPGSGAHQIERNQIVALKKSNNFPCETVDTDDYRFHYRDYLEKIEDSVFAPCPAGNTHETYRLYEALELGK